MNLKETKRTMTILNVAACVLAVGGALANYMDWGRGAMYALFGGALALLLGSIVYSGQRYRCPHCGTRLPVNGPLPNRCPHCQQLLEP